MPKIISTFIFTALAVLLVAIRFGTGEKGGQATQAGAKSISRVVMGVERYRRQADCYGRRFS